MKMSKEQMHSQEESPSATTVDKLHFDNKQPTFCVMKILSGNRETLVLISPQNSKGSVLTSDTSSHADFRHFCPPQDVLLKQTLQLSEAGCVCFFSVYGLLDGMCVHCLCARKRYYFW